MSNWNDPAVSQAWRDSIEALCKHDCAEARERERIAAVLHDDFGQCLAAIGLMLDRLAGTDRAQLQACIGDIRRTLTRLDTAWRQAVLPPEPEQAPDAAPDILPALANLCSAAEREMQLRCSLQVAADAAPPTTAGARVLLRGVSELLLNVRKHAGSPYVSVRMGSRGSWVEVAVRDYGHTSLESELERRRVRGFGLTNLKHELRKVGGDMRVEAVAPGRNVRVRVPALQWACDGRGVRA